MLREARGEPDRVEKVVRVAGGIQGSGADQHGQGQGMATAPLSSTHVATTIEGTLAQVWEVPQVSGRGVCFTQGWEVWYGLGDLPGHGTLSKRLSK